MSNFVVQRHTPKPAFAVESLAPSARRNERASFDLTITVADKPVAKLYSCKLVHGQNGTFVSGPSFPNDEGKWVNIAFLGRELHSEVITLVETMLAGECNGS